MTIFNKSAHFANIKNNNIVREVQERCSGNELTCRHLDGKIIDRRVSRELAYFLKARMFSAV